MREQKSGGRQEAPRQGRGGVKGDGVKDNGLLLINPVE